MRHVILTPFLVMFCVLLLASVAAPQPGRGVTVVARTAYGPVELYRDSWALVVGINDYVNWPKLRFARADAEAVARMLTEKLGFSKDHVFTLYDREATRKGILGVLEDRLADSTVVGPEDRVFIYFAGHGDTKQERGYLMPVDAEQGKGYSATAISMQELKDIIAVDRIRAKHLYLVADACYSGMLFVARGAGVERDHPRYIQEITRRKARQVLAAGGKEPVSDSGRNGHSIFTAWFLDAVGGGLADLNGDGFITAAEISGFLPSRVANDLYSQQTPEFGDLPGSEGGEFVFNVIPASVEEAAEQAQKTRPQGVPGSDINAKDNYDRTDLIWAAWKGHTAIVKALLTNGADVNAKDRDGWTALTYAGTFGHTTTVQALLEGGADVNAKDRDGKTALMWAAWKGHTDIVKALLDKGADVNAKDNYGKTALMRAAWYDHKGIIQLVEKAGARE